MVDCVVKRFSIFGSPLRFMSSKNPKPSEIRTDTGHLRDKDSPAYYLFNLNGCGKSKRFDVVKVRLLSLLSIQRAVDIFLCMSHSKTLSLDFHCFNLF